MNENADKSKLGELVISEDVIASIALNAARDVDGVISFTQRPTDIVSVLKKPDGNKYVNVSIGDNDVKISLYIIVKSGMNIQSIANEVQKTVKSTVQSMTGKIVTKVNVTISGQDTANQ